MKLKRNYIGSLFYKMAPQFYLKVFVLLKSLQSLLLDKKKRKYDSQVRILIQSIKMSQVLKGFFSEDEKLST